MSGTNPDGQMLAGFGKMDITPAPHKSFEIYDPIYFRALHVRQGDRQVTFLAADLFLFDPDTVGITPAERVSDLPGGGRRTIRRPIGVHGVFCNGVEVFDGSGYVTNGRGPGRVLDRFAPSSAFRGADGEGASP